MPTTHRRSPAELTRIMRLVHSTNTSPEVLLRKALWARGIRYRTCQQSLPGKPDVVVRSRKLAIFVDGDYWHGGQWRRRKLLCLEDQFPATPKKDYWIRKIRRNMQRDCEATEALVSDGWTVLRFWESEIKQNLDRCVEMCLKTNTKAGAPRRHTDSANLLAEKSVAEFFAGIGLMRMGLERQGWRVRMAHDIDPAKGEMYREQFSAAGEADDRYSLGDVHQLRAAEVPSVTLATASFPCNDLSLAGSRNGLKGKQSSAFWGFTRVLKNMRGRRPPLVLLENVTGFLTSHGGADFREALEALNALGYAVDAFMLDAAHFVPQSRQRLFVVGALDGVLGRTSTEGAAAIASGSLRPKALTNFINANPRIRWNIRNLPPVIDRRGDLGSVLEELEPDDPMWWARDRAKKLIGQMDVRHRGVAERMIRGRRWTYGTIFRRTRGGKTAAELRTDGLAGCLRTPRGGSARQILFKAGRGEYHVRLLTGRECARLMGADDFKIDAPLNQTLFGFGDAVCVPAIEWIAKYYLNPLVGELIRGRPLGSGVRGEA